MYSGNAQIPGENGTILALFRILDFLSFFFFLEY